MHLVNIDSEVYEDVQNWLITLDRFDVAYAVNSLSRHNMLLRHGHLKAMMRIFGYLPLYPHITHFELLCTW